MISSTIQYNDTGFLNFGNIFCSSEVLIIKVPMNVAFILDRFYRFIARSKRHQYEHFNR